MTGRHSLVALLAAASNEVKLLDVAGAGEQAGFTPVHEGAERFWKEQGSKVRPEHSAR